MFFWAFLASCFHVVLASAKRNTVCFSFKFFWSQIKTTEEISTKCRHSPTPGKRLFVSSPPETLLQWSFVFALSFYPHRIVCERYQAVMPICVLFYVLEFFYSTMRVFPPFLATTDSGPLFKCFLLDLNPLLQTNICPKNLIWFQSYPPPIGHRSRTCQRRVEPQLEWHGLGGISLAAWVSKNLN